MLRAFIAIVCLGALTACGQYGSLYLPDPVTQQTTDAPPPPVYTTAE